MISFRFMNKDVEHGQKRLARQIAHDLRSVISAWQGLELSVEEIGVQRFELHQTALARMQKIVANLSESQYEMKADDIANLFSFLKYDLGLKVRSGACSYFCQFRARELKNVLQTLEHSEEVSLSSSANEVQLDFYDQSERELKSLRFQKSAAPAWHVDKIILKKGQRLISLDDDQFFQQKLKTRYDHLDWNLRQSLQDFSISKRGEFIHLIDYDFGEKVNGLDFIVANNLKDCAYLVTNMDQDPELLAACLKHGISLISKSLILDELFTIDYEKDDQKIVLIDDDSLIHSLWKSRALKSGVDLSCFSSIEEFLKKSDEFSKDTQIFVDSDLGSEVRGEVAAKKIFDLGFTQLKLCSGYVYDDEELPHYILEACAKRPPF